MGAILTRHRRKNQKQARSTEETSDSHMKPIQNPESCTLARQSLAVSWQKVRLSSKASECAATPEQWHVAGLAGHTTNNSVRKSCNDSDNCANMDECVGS